MKRLKERYPAYEGFQIEELYYAIKEELDSFDELHIEEGEFYKVGKSYLFETSIIFEVEVCLLKQVEIHLEYIKIKNEIRDSDIRKWSYIPNKFIKLTFKDNSIFTINLKS